MTGSGHCLLQFYTSSQSFSHSTALLWHRSVVFPQTRVWKRYPWPLRAGERGSFPEAPIDLHPVLQWRSLTGFWQMGGCTVQCTKVHPVHEGWKHFCCRGETLGIRAAVTTTNHKRKCPYGQLCEYVYIVFVCVVNCFLMLHLWSFQFLVLSDNNPNMFRPYLYLQDFSCKDLVKYDLLNEWKWMCRVARAGCTCKYDTFNLGKDDFIFSVMTSADKSHQYILKENDLEVITNIHNALLLTVGI